MPRSGTRRVLTKSASEHGGTPFQAIEPPARVLLSDSIVSQIEGLIVQGVLKPGDRLPPERELAEQLAVSRPSLREATLKLEARGLVHARRGGGYHVADVTAPTLTDPLVHLLQEHPPASYDILELRQGLEEKAAYLAAQRRTEADLRILKRRFAALVESDRTRGNAITDAETDLEFHLAIADASHNVALVHVMHGLFNLLRTSTYRFRELVFTMGDGTEKLLNGQHRAIYDAVVKGDANGARDAIHLHLSFIDASLREAELLPGVITKAAKGRPRRVGVAKSRAVKARRR